MISLAFFMKQKTIAIFSIAALIVILAGTFAAIGVHAFSQTNANNSQDRAQRGYGMMGNLNSEQIRQMDKLHDNMVKSLDNETASWMNSMHERCIGADDGSD